MVLLVSGPIRLLLDCSVSMAPPFVKCRLLGLYPEASSQDAEGRTKEVGLPSFVGQERLGGLR